MSEINFYQTDEILAKAIAPLLLKVLEEKKKALIFCANQAQIKEVDSALWSYGRNSFIPHILDSDKNFDFARQPILITDKEENLNKADYLVMLNEASSGFASSFERVFYFFAKLDQQPKLQPINFYKRQENKWVKVS